MRALSRDLTSPDNLILDLFLGSGTIGITSLLVGRWFGGFEKMKSHFDVKKQ